MRIHRRGMLEPRPEQGPLSAPVQLGTARARSRWTSQATDSQGRSRRASHDAPHLSYLDLSNSGFSGKIPDSIADMVYLNVLNLEHDRLDGQIPERFNALGRLTTLGVADNLFIGVHPCIAAGVSDVALCWLRAINDQSIIGAAVGFVVAFYFYLYFPRWPGLSKRLRASGLRV
ncbi:hypothetical protein ZWY2020_046904 [Hordeum vulgare]|nr:hypothetical protein ZWY2020_046904 [Hordeum vulgare]